MMGEQALLSLQSDLSQVKILQSHSRLQLQIQVVYQNRRRACVPDGADVLDRDWDGIWSNVSDSKSTAKIPVQIYVKILNALFPPEARNCPYSLGPVDDAFPPYTLHLSTTAMNYLKSITSSVLNSTGVSFPFSIGERIPGIEAGGTIWELRDGVKKVCPSAIRRAQRGHTSYTTSAGLMIRMMVRC